MSTEQAEAIISMVGNKLSEAFGEALPDTVALATAKALGYVEGKRGRTGGTFATPAGLYFAGLSGEVVNNYDTEEENEKIQA